MAIFDDAIFDSAIFDTGATSVIFELLRPPRRREPQADAPHYGIVQAFLRRRDVFTVEEALVLGASAGVPLDELLLLLVAADEEKIF